MPCLMFTASSALTAVTGSQAHSPPPEEGITPANLRARCIIRAGTYACCEAETFISGGL